MLIKHAFSTKIVAKLSLLICIFAMILFQSCEKEGTQDLELPNPQSISSVANLDLTTFENLKVKNGLVIFDDAKSFKEALEKYANIDQNALANWEEANQFHSLRGLYHQADEEFESYLEMGEKEAFEQKWKDVVRLGEENSLDPYLDFSFNIFLNRSHLFAIGDVLCKVYPDKIASIYNVSFDEIPNFQEIDELNERYPVAINQIIVNGQELDRISLRDDIRSCTHKSDENNRGSYSLETRLRLIEAVISTGINNNKIRVASVHHEAISKRKKRFGWFKDGAFLSINGSATVGTSSTNTGSYSISAGPTFTRELDIWRDEVGISSNSNYQYFRTPTNITFESSRVPGELCIYTE